MTTLDRPIYKSGMEVVVGVTRKRNRRATLICKYERPVGHGGLHYVTDLSTGDTLRVPIEDIARHR